MTNEDVKLTNEELFTNAMEEASEVIQACSKCIRFGCDSSHPSKPYTNNGNEVIKEFYHLEALIYELQKNKVLPKFSSSKIKYIKDDKIERIKRWKLKNKGGVKK